MATDHVMFAESVTTLASRIHRACGPQDANEFWRLIRQAENGAAPRNRLQLLHTIQDNTDKLTLQDAFALLSSKLPVDINVQKTWEQLAIVLANSLNL